MQDGNELYQLLRQSSGGSEDIYKHSLVRRFNYTEGVRDFARNAGNGAQWLLDILATEPKISKLIKNEGFGLVILKVTGSKALLTVAGDTGVAPVFSQEIEYTDCPEAPVTKYNPSGHWKFYLEATVVGEMEVIMCMLPNER